MPAFSLRQIHSPVNRREKAHFLFFIFPFSHNGFKTRESTFFWLIFQFVVGFILCVILTFCSF